jgi:hypothetical protein
VRARRILWGAAAVSFAAAGVAAWLATRPPAAGVPAPDVVVSRFQVTGTPRPPWLGDSLARALVRGLRGNTDFRVRLAASADDTASGHVLDGRATVRGDSLEVRVTAAPGASRTGIFLADAAGTLVEWDRTATALAYQVLFELWSERNASLAADLPRSAAPRTPEGLRAFLQAELLFAHAQWAEAYQAYGDASRIDPTCLICAVRIEHVARWLGYPPDTAAIHRYRAALDSFPPRYHDLLAAEFEPPVEQLQTLRELTARYPGWGFVWFVLGDQIFHRGPLQGVPRSESLRPFEEAALRRPDFAPGWEHLAWAATAEGDSATADTALDHYAAIASSGDAKAMTIGALLRAGFLWRFAPEAVARAFTEQVLRSPGIAAAQDLDAAPSFLLTFEAPRGAVYLGERFAAGVPRPDLALAGLLGQVYGLTALGRVDSALALARLAAARTANPEIALFAAELPAALALADSDAVDVRWPVLSAPLDQYVSGAVQAPTLLRARAAWMLSLLAARARQGAEAERYRRIVDDAGTPAAPLADFLAVVLGPVGHGNAGSAVQRSAPLVALDSANRGGDPFYRALLHLGRASWQVAAGAPTQAAADLRWHENNDFTGYPGREAPQAGEVDYALATLARWDRARLLRTLGPAYRGEACTVLADLARAWRDGTALYAARADSARAWRSALDCEATR